ncbi:VOC family protein [Nocardia beijingensis]|uniref:VOC family protein n=1 Tax=Nocardia beijingensis TaxID=95162 RepID=UPI001895ABBF|nr:VOC family protein [Nocardia beijingensis]MBF6079520.1 VOC family protein [Nocardia beijingensis]
MPGPFESIHHICIVVADIDAAIQFYDSVGIGPWHDYPPLTQYTELDVPNTEAFLGLRYMYAMRGTCQIQLVEPGTANSPQRIFLDKTGGGVFHIGFDVADIAGSTDQAGELGLTPWMTGRRPDGSGFSYFDTGDVAGVTLEIRQSPPPE